MVLAGLVHQLTNPTLDITPAIPQMLTHAETSGTPAPIPPLVQGGDGHAEIDGEFVDGEESVDSVLVFDSQLVSFLTGGRSSSASWVGRGS
jgi:hypothetical protein